MDSKDKRQQTMESIQQTTDSRQQTTDDKQSRNNQQQTRDKVCTTFLVNIQNLNIAKPNKNQLKLI